MHTTSLINHEKLAHPKPQSTADTVTTVNSIDALAMVEHGSELTLSITTPVGTKFLCKTVFIGTHSDTYLLIETPKISADDLNYYFQQGFWIHIRAISSRGEGAKIHFRSQLLHTIQDPLALLVLSIPNTMQVTQLRQEPRYEVNLAARVICENQRSECEVRDLSKNGCRFITPPLSRHWQVGDHVSIDISTERQHSQVFSPLTGRICNLQRSIHHVRYGLKFDESGRESAKTLLGQLKFNGTKLMLTKSSQ